MKYKILDIEKGISGNMITARNLENDLIITISTECSIKNKKKIKNLLNKECEKRLNSGLLTAGEII